MCDGVPGQLILTFSPRNEAAEKLLGEIKHEKLVHVSHLESLKDRLKHLDMLHDGVKSEYHLLGVPEGEEPWAIAQVYRRYTELIPLIQITRQPDGFAVGLNAYLHTAGAALSGFDFEAFHPEYRRMIGLQRDGARQRPATDEIAIKVLDSGTAQEAGLKLVTLKNFLDPKDPRTDDDVPHGSVVTKIISDLAPGARLHVFKIADRRGLASEWNVLAALGADVDERVHIANLSLTYGFSDRDCPACGRSSGTHRSWVFEQFLSQAAGSAVPPFLVAAAGNAGRPELAYPARFGTVIAVGAVNASKTLARFSNWGATSHDAGQHRNFFVLPGGEQRGEEFVAIERSSGKRLWGTSFAAAYCTGVLANVLADLQEYGPMPKTEAVLKGLRKRAEPIDPPSRYGNGLMRATELPGPA